MEGSCPFTPGQEPIIGNDLVIGLGVAKYHCGGYIPVMDRLTVHRGQVVPGSLTTEEGVRL